MADWEREVRDALERAGADDLDRPRARFRREPEPLPDSPGWGFLTFLQPATPWHLIGVGALMWLFGRMAFSRGALGEPLVLLGLVLVVVGVLSLLLVPDGGRPKRWRGRLVYLNDNWRTRLYRRLYRR